MHWESKAFFLGIIRKTNNVYHTNKILTLDIEPYCITASFFKLFYRLLGTIPGPILYGRLIDEACILSSGKCLLYNNYNMGVYLTIATCVGKLLSVLCFLVALYTSKWCKIPEDPDVDVEIPSRRTTLQQRVSTRKLTR